MIYSVSQIFYNGFQMYSFSITMRENIVVEVFSIMMNINLLKFLLRLDKNYMWISIMKIVPPA